MALNLCFCFPSASYDSLQFCEPSMSRNKVASRSVWLHDTYGEGGPAKGDEAYIGRINQCD